LSHIHKEQYIATKDARVHYTVLKIRAGTPARVHHYPRKASHQGEQHTLRNTITRSLVRAGPNHTPHRTSRCGSGLEKPNQESAKIPTARFLRTQQRASAFHPTPLTFHASSPKRIGSTCSIGQDPGLMVNVPHSEAPSP
jgi:hypothetical protein